MGQLISSQQQEQSSAVLLLSPLNLQAYLEQISDALIAIDFSCNYTFVNKKACDLLERDAQSLLGKNLWAEFPEAVNSPFYQAVMESIQTGKFSETATYISRFHKWFERRIHPTDTGLLIFFNDITPKKQQEAALQDALQELECFKEALTVSGMVAITQPNGIIRWVNEQFCNATQYQPEELIGQLHPAFTTTDTAWQQALQDGKRWQGERLNKRKDGTSLWTLSTLVPFCKGQHEPTHYVIICQDISERIQAEKKLAESEKLYRSLIENYTDPVFLTDLQGNIHLINQQAESITGMNRQELLDYNFLNFLSEEARSRISASLPMLLQGKSLQIKTILESTLTPFSAVVALVPIQEEGQIKHFFVKFRNVSRMVEFEREFNLLNETTQALSTSASLKEGTSAVIKLLCKFGDFQYGECWMPLFGQHHVKMKSSWGEQDVFSLMRTASENLLYDITCDKPELLASGKWYFSGHALQDPNFRRKPEALRCGIQSYLSIPIIYRQQLLGIISLFSTHKREQLHLNADRLQEMLGKLGGELERRHSTEELDRFFTVSPTLMGIFNFEGYALKLNPAVHQILGYSDKELSNCFLPGLVHPADVEKLETSRQAMHRGQSFYSLEIRIKCKSGQYRWFAISTQSLPEENLTYVVAQDVHEHKLQLDELEKVKIAIDNTSDAIVIASDLKNCLYTNSAFFKLLGWNAETLNQLGWTIIFVQPELPYQIADCLANQQHWEGDLELYDAEGNIRDFNLRANTFVSESEKNHYLVGIFTDVAEQKKARREVERLNRAIEESANEIYIYNPDTLHLTYVNRKGQQNMGYTLEEFNWLTPWMLSPKYNRFSYLRLVHPLLSGKVKTLFYRTIHQRKDKSLYPVEVHLSWFKDDASHALIAHVIDITEQKKAEDALLLSNERYQLVARATNDAIWDYDLINEIGYYGDGFKTIFGHNFGNTYGKLVHWVEQIHPEDVERVIANFHESIVQKRTEWIIEYRYCCADGNYRYVKDRGYLIINELGEAIRATGAMSDNTEQKRSESLLKQFNEELSKKVEEKTSKLGHALRHMRQEVIARVRTEESLHQSLKEKEVLLKEIHHRVKNNMAIISGLLSLQARHAPYPEMKSILEESQSRITSMALIHEMLYQNNNLAKINFRQYIQQLTRVIADSFRFLDQQIEVSIDAEDAELDIVHAVPCALILNELLTNCFKYAFPHEQKGQIKISFLISERHYMLSITDDGIGLPKSFDPHKGKTLGMQLVRSLVRQIGGEMSIAGEKGTNFTIVWKN